MDKNLKIYYIPHHSESWYRFRSIGLTKEDAIQYKCDQYNGGIGGSEIGVFADKDKRYDSPIWPFHYKVGTIPIRKEDNERMFWGRELEENIARKWCFYDGSKTGYIENFANNKIVRKCRNVNGYIVHPKYPWLFVSLDRLINKGGVNLITGEIMDKEGILECKNIGEYNYKHWENEIPRYIIYQIQQQMLITDTNYTEIAILKGGNDFNVEKIQRDDNLIKELIEVSHYWWYDRIIPAREALHERNKYDIDGDTKGAEQCQAIIDKLEPEADSSQSYMDYMNEQYMKEKESIEGDLPMILLAKKDRCLLSYKTRIEKERKKISNQFINILIKSGAEKIDFGSLGYISYKMMKGYKNGKFNNEFKKKPDEDIIEERFKNIDTDY